jgi:RHS repeat-associated protein
MSNVFNARVALTLLIGVMGLTSVVGAQLRAKDYDGIDVSLASAHTAAQFADPTANHALSAVAQRAFGELSANDAWTKNGVALGSNSAGVTQPAREAANASYPGAPVVGTRLIDIHPDAEQQRLRVGSPLMATDGAGAALWREDYSAFGVRRKNETAANSGSAANSLWYIGKPQDNVTGLVYFGARWYDPQVGRFMGFDPAGVDEDNPHSFNRYANGNNNPYKYLDPDGRVPLVVAAVYAAPYVAAGASAAYGAVRAAPFVQRGVSAAMGVVHTLNVHSGSVIAAAEAGLALTTGASTPATGPGAFVRVAESMSARAASYQARVTGTPEGFGYVVNGVKFDGFVNGVLVDAKSAYGQFVQNGQFAPWFSGTKGLVDQARRQVDAAKGTPIQWKFAEESAANATKSLFKEQGIKGIDISVAP